VVGHQPPVPPQVGRVEVPASTLGLEVLDGDAPVPHADRLHGERPAPERIVERVRVDVVEDRPVVGEGSRQDVALGVVVVADHGRSLAIALRTALSQTCGTRPSFQHSPQYPYTVSAHWSHIENSVMARGRALGQTLLDSGFNSGRLLGMVLRGIALPFQGWTSG